jgi:hypothetical protein
MSAWTFVRRPNDHPLVAKDPTPTQWAATVLQQLGIPQSPGAVQALTGWARAEGGHWNNQARFNPLNTTQPEPGYTKTGAQGNIGSYTSWQQGVDATVKTLTNGRYAPILSALKAGDANPRRDQPARPAGRSRRLQQAERRRHARDRGLAGYPARDFFAPAGSHAVAPISGKVIKLSGPRPAQRPDAGTARPARLVGLHQGLDGKTYFLTHMGSRNVKVGRRSSRAR